MSKKKRYLRYPLVMAVLLLVAAPIAAAKKPAITIWVYSGTLMPQMHESHKDEVEARFRVDFNIVAMDGSTLFIRLFEAERNGRGLPDMIETMGEFNYDGTLWNQDRKRSMLIPLNKWADKSRILQYIPRERLAFHMIGRNLYGLPEDASPMVLAYNDEVWRQKGIDLSKVQTWDEYFSLCKPLCRDSDGDGRPDHYAFYDTNGLDPTLYAMIQQSGAQFVTAGGKPSITSKSFLDVLRKWVQWSKETPMMLVNSVDDPNAAIADGKLLAFPSAGFTNKYAADYLQTNFPGKGRGQMRAMPLPAWEKGGARTAYYFTWFKGITREAANPELCYRIAEWLNYAPGNVRDLYQQVGMIAPLTKSYGDPVFHQPEPGPFFGGQKIAQLQLSLIKQMPKVNTGWRFYALKNTVSNAISRIMNKEVSIEQAINDALRQANENLRRGIRLY